MKKSKKARDKAKLKRKFNPIGIEEALAEYLSAQLKTDINREFLHKVMELFRT